MAYLKKNIHPQNQIRAIISSIIHSRNIYLYYIACRHNITPFNFKKKITFLIHILPVILTLHLRTQRTQVS